MANDPKMTHPQDEMYGGRCPVCLEFQDNCPNHGDTIPVSRRRVRLMENVKITVRQYRYGLERGEQAQAIEDALREMGFMARVMG